MDFGLVKETDSNSLTSTGGIEGTPAYMSPEQARGDNKTIDLRADLYGLGATLYSILVGRPPFAGSSTDVLLAVLTEEPTRLRSLDPTIPPALETIVLKCLEKEPERRYESALALATDLGRFLEGQRIAARPPGVLRRMAHFARRHKLLVASAAAALLASLILGGVALRIRLQAAAQARLAQELGQEITKMEWILRSARQMPLHDLGAEKAIIRHRMQKLQNKLEGYGEVARGLAHYALGRGHMALHEYPQALEQLQLARQGGHDSAELHYALGFVLGKHFEKALYEARLSGGGSWAKRQLAEVEPRYLAPAIASLSRSRTMQLDAPEYLEALISYYQGNYELALQQAEKAQRNAPWLYEATKLCGDVHLERAVQARDKGSEQEAKQEFTAAVKSYEAAARIGQSDGEIYEGLAEAWVRQLEMSLRSGHEAGTAYQSALGASDKLLAVEPLSAAGHLKKASAAMITTSILGLGIMAADHVELCLKEAMAVIGMEPENLFAPEFAAGCYAGASEVSRQRGEDPGPYLRKAIEILEPVVRRAPHFLWGLNDLGNHYSALGTYFTAHGEPSARSQFEKSLEYYSVAHRLDPRYLSAISGAMWTLAELMAQAKTLEEVQALARQGDEKLQQCLEIHSQPVECYDNYAILYVRAAMIAQQSGKDPQPYIQTAREKFGALRHLGANVLDAEEHQVQLALVEARARLQRKEDPAAALEELKAAAARCFAISAEDARCRTGLALASLAEAAWLSQQNRPILPVLEEALRRAQQATASPEHYAEAWQTLAETHLRLARLLEQRPLAREQHIREGLAAVEKVFAINQNSGQAWATLGSLQLLGAQAAREPAARQTAAREAVKALKNALAKSPLLSHDYAPLLEAAQAAAPAL